MLVCAAIVYCFLFYRSINAAPISAPSESTSISQALLSRGVRSTDLCPRTRLEIIWSCVATILAASWVSVHPNMPAQNDSRLKKVLLRIDLMFWAVITPELMIY
ncbi:hypothetical protein CPC08DRAFT_100302 [Agrocybe pediades]|nr:hypothetical protein CPC08DRAFT_100302 [Agrocybe pediades]